MSTDVRAAAAANDSGRSADDAPCDAEAEHHTNQLPLPTLAEDELDAEQRLRLDVLILLYRRRLAEPRAPSISLMELRTLTGTRRDHLEFALWFLTQKGHVIRSESATLLMTVSGAEFLEQQSRIIRRLPSMLANAAG